jgi:formate dehydrogenase subunit gamma
MIGALLTAAALVLPAAAFAQATGAGPTPPVTAPTKDAGKKPEAPPATADAPKVSSPPTPQAGSTAVPGWNNPPAWNSASERPAYASLPGVEKNRLIQGAGREWREFRNGPLTKYGGWMLVLVLIAIAAFYLLRGPLKLHGQPTGRLIERFNAIERVSHWVMAIAFVLLALSGIVIIFGKHIILPWLGYTAFSWLTIASKNVHNFVGPLFIFTLVVMILLYVKDNLPRAYDIDWLKKAGGMFGGPEVPSGKFNAGEKLWFWGGMVFLGTFVCITGLILDFPNWNQGREAMQQANVVHAVCALFFMAASFGHIYLGTLGVPGAYGAMRDGYVDEQWAREHHGNWYEQVKAGNRPEKFVGGAAPVPAAGDD